MTRFVFTGVAFVSGVEIAVEAVTLGEAVAMIAQEDSAHVDTDKGELQYYWADLNSGRPEGAK